MDEWKQKREVMQQYNQTASSYDAQYAKEQKAKIKAALGEVHFKDNSLILDLGCGTGLLFPHTAAQAKLLVGIDISKNLLRQAKKRAKQHPNIALIKADADYTPFKHKAFHTIFAITLLQNMPNPTATLKEIGRIAKPNGTIILTILKKRFTRKVITELLKETKLKITAIKTKPEIKDHIITCQNP